MEIFAGISSSDGYQKMLSHLGPDPKVQTQVYIEQRSPDIDWIAGAQLIPCYARTQIARYHRFQMFALLRSYILSTGFVRFLASWMAEAFMGDKIFATILRAARYKSVGEFNAWHEHMHNYEKEFYEDVR